MNRPQLTSNVQHLPSIQSRRASQGSTAEICPSLARRACNIFHLFFLLFFCLLSGCSSWLPELVPFGAVSAPDHNRSLNGLGLHRKMWESSGAKCLTPQRLSPKLDNMDVIVLVGQSFEPPGLTARRWLEDWLAQEPGRTVVYFGRDFNADLQYRRQTISQLEPALQPRGEELLAMSEVRELNLRLRELPESTFCGWFFFDTQHPNTVYQNFTGSWADDLSAKLSQSNAGWPVRVALQPPDNRLFSSKKPAFTTPKSTNVAPVNSQQATVDGENNDELSGHSQWDPEELDTPEKWTAELRRAPRSETLVAADDGQALAFRLTSTRFEGSQILVVANGAPLLNGSLVEPLHQHFGERLIEACRPADRVALLAFDQSGISFSNVPEKDNRAAGLEMLTVWPLSGITMPAALLGLIVCASLLPILGRPQSLVQRSVSDFGLHVDAIGRMLFEARDATHAKTAITDYFLKVRGENPPDWLDAVEERD